MRPRASRAPALLDDRAARPRHGDGRTAGHQRRRGLSECAGHRDASGSMRATCCAPSSGTGATKSASLLSATCDFAPDAAPAGALAGARSRGHHARIHRRQRRRATRFFWAAAARTPPGAYFAAKLAAARLEIWTDVPGLFSANPRTVPYGAAAARRCITMRLRKSPATGPRFCTRAACCRCASTKSRCMSMRRRRRGSKAPWSAHNVADSAAQVKAIAIKKGITLVSMESPGMWHQVGFLADAFQVFKQQGLSVDLVSTSETNVTVSLDPSANTLDHGGAGAPLTASLGELCRVEVLGPCASLSLLGHNIRGILHELGSAFELFQDHKIYLVTPGGERPELHLRDRRIAGRPAGAAAARAADPQASAPTRSWDPPGNSCSPTKACRRGAGVRVGGKRPASGGSCSTSPRANRPPSSTTWRAVDAAIRAVERGRSRWSAGHTP